MLRESEERVWDRLYKNIDVSPDSTPPHLSVFLCLNDFFLDQFFPPASSFLFHRFSTVSINLGPLRIALLSLKLKERNVLWDGFTYINGGSWMDGGRS